MLKLIKTVDEEWHIASDWRRGYKVKDGVDLTSATAVCKFRDELDNVLAVADCHIQGNTIIVEVLGHNNTNVPRFAKRGRYDVFILMGGQQYKVVMGRLTIIQDVLMH